VHQLGGDVVATTDDVQKLQKHSNSKFTTINFLFA
jgi:hypothetical protein